MERKMIKKSYSKNGRTCRVTFKLPADVEAEAVHLVGDFNDWDEASHLMKHLKDGSFSITISLETGKDYRFRYLLDGEAWENDWSADSYVPNEFGTEDSLVRI
jgi:1,4-alpha-glucan branching enzyme